MNATLNKNNLYPPVLIIIGAAVLAFDPLLWLIKTWNDPSYGSSGFWFALVPATLFTWSITSEKKLVNASDRNFPVILLLTSAIIRGSGQILAVNMIGAITLIIDVYAIARILGLDNRVRAISPFWLSMLFAFSLPIERVIQRVLGYSLQNMSADGACAVLGGLFDNVSCQGIRILINAKDVMVDLPCSGARAFLLLLFLFSALNAVWRFSLEKVLKGLGITIVAALISNIIRICVLSAGVGYPELVGSINVMSQPAHDVIGFLTLSLGGIPVILWAKRCQNSVPAYSLPKKIIQDGWWLSTGTKKTGFLAASFLIAAIVITTLPKKAFDVAARDLPLELPANISGHDAAIIPLLAQEKAYFMQYGGSAKKALYGDQSLLMVKTSAPLRHLHTPDDCLRGLGYDVEYLGIDYSHIPSAIYKATHENGISYRVAVSFASADFSHITTNVSQAVWHWMQNSKTSWLSVQRISLWDDPNAISFDRAVFSALAINQPSIQLAKLKEKFDD